MSKLIKNVLIVEDDLILSMVMVRMMEKLRFNVLEKCYNGEKAVYSAKSMQPDLILMDIQLEDDFDGIMAMHKIREFSNVPVIYITGNSDRESIERAKKTNYIAYLVKPIQMDDLKGALEKVERIQ